MKSAKTYIITPTWNNADYTLRCFDSIAKYTTNYCIVWIDNGSKEEDRERVREFLESGNIPHIAILNEENQGFVKGTNQGIIAAMEDPSMEYIVFENNDTEVTEGWLDRYIEVAESDSEIGLVGPITSPCDSWQSIEFLKGKYGIFDDIPKYQNDHDQYAVKIKRLYHGRVYNADDKILAFFSTIIKREVLEQVGNLSEDFGVGYRDDDDYAERARKQGWKLVLACDVFVFHNHRTTFKKLYTDGEIEELLENNMRILEAKHNHIKFRIGNRSAAYYTSLSRKAWRTLREQGLKKTCVDIGSYFKYGRDYFK